MERRYVLVGLVVIALAVTFMVYGIVVASDRIVGTALSVSVIGIVFIIAGFGYSEPTEDMLRHYIEDLDAVLVRLIEDMGIPSKHKLKLCYEKKTFYFSSKDIECNNIVVGIGTAKNIPYVGISAENILKFVMHSVGVGDLIDKLRNIFIETAMVCRGISVTREDSLISIEFIDLTNIGFNYIKMPVNPLRLYVLAVIAHHFEQNVEIVTEIVSQESYKVTLRLEGTKYG
ncbi:MAG: hypothetical protein QXF17_04420 [Ignisphaera sp.]